MSNQKHTPGPWTRERGERFRHDHSAGVRGPNNLYIAAALDMNNLDKDEEVEANARLIAAAPKMLAALKAILEFADNGTPVHPGALVIEDAREAVREAEDA